MVVNTKLLIGSIAIFVSSLIYLGLHLALEERPLLSGQNTLIQKQLLNAGSFQIERDRKFDYQTGSIRFEFSNADTQDKTLYIHNPLGRIEIFQSDYLLYRKNEDFRYTPANPIVMDLSEYPLNFENDNTSLLIKYRVSNLTWWENFIWAGLSSAVYLGETNSINQLITFDKFSNVYIGWVILGIQLAFCLIFYFDRALATANQPPAVPSELLLAHASLMVINVASFAGSYAINFAANFALPILALCFIGYCDNTYRQNLKGIELISSVLLVSFAIAAALFIDYTELFNGITDFQMLIVLIAPFTPILFIAALSYSFITAREAKDFLFTGLMTMFVLAIFEGTLAKFGFVNVSYTEFPFVQILYYLFIIYVLSHELADDNENIHNTIVNQTTQLAVMKREISKASEISLNLQKNLTLQRQMRDLHTDLHDGVLSNLSTIKMKLHRQNDKNIGEIESLVSRTMSEIRFILDNGNQSFNNSYATFAGLIIDHIINPNKQEGLAIVSELHPELYEYLEFTDRQHPLLLFRLFQELFNNAIVRADATSIDVIVNHFRLEDGINLEFSVINRGGKSLDRGNIKASSYGIKNMERRCEAAKIEFELQPIDGGAKAKFTVPFKDKLSR